jgi:hypothetical protein
MQSLILGFTVGDAIQYFNPRPSKSLVVLGGVMLSQRLLSDLFHG